MWETQRKAASKEFSVVCINIHKYIFLNIYIYNLSTQTIHTNPKHNPSSPQSRFRDYMLEIFSEFALEVMGRLEEAAINQKPVDVQDLFFRYTFDSFGKLAFGLDVGCLSGEESPPFAYAFDQANVLTSQRFFDVLWPLKRMFGIGSEGMYHFILWEGKEN